MLTSPVTPAWPDLLKQFHDQNRDHALILLDAEGRVVAWLAACEHVFGYSAEEMLGRSLEVLFTPEDRALELFRHELAVAASNGRAEDDRWKVRKNGTRIWVFGVLIVIRDENGKVMGFGKVMRNRTDVKAQIETLENRVEFLRQELDRRGAFLGTLAHELRNPLAPISNAIEIVRTVGGSQFISATNILSRQLAVLQRLVDDLLDVSRINTGKVRLSIETVNLQDILNAAAEVCRESCEARGLNFNAILPKIAINLDADPARLGQVFTNLFNNAIKYTPSGGHIWVKATVEGSEAVVRVQDTGVGIAAEMLPKIFDLFTQEDTSLTRSEGGLGIGLALVKDLISLHGGVIQVRSDGKGKGSEFSVRVPLKQPPAPRVKDAP